MSDFLNFYMRPNPENKGTIPARGVKSASPDIWISGTSPLLNYQRELTTESSYNSQSTQRLAYWMSNYIYVRCRNGSGEALTQNVTLYYAQSNVLSWPDQWKGNVIGTDLGPEEKGKLKNIQPKTIAVCDRPFFWSVVPRPKSDTHFCLMAQINDDKNSNPFPAITTNLDLASLVADNLRWGWRNVEVFDSGSSPDCVYTVEFSVPIDVRDEELVYHFIMKPEMLEGCKVAFTASSADAKGQPIELKPTMITSGSGMTLGCVCTLKRGFRAMITVYFYNPSHKSLPLMAKLPLETFYETNDHALEKAGLEHLYTDDIKMTVKNMLDNGDKNNPRSYTHDSWGSRALVRVGGYTGLFK